MTETDFAALIYLLNHFQGTIQLEKTHPTYRFLDCAVSHITQELSPQQIEQYQVRPKMKTEHPSKSILAS